MKKILTAIAMVTMCLAFLGGCTLPFANEQEQAEQKPTTHEKEEIGAPFVGYYVMDEKSQDAVDVVRQTIPNAPDVRVLKYMAGENNKVVVRTERSKPDGTWEVKSQNTYLMVNNVRNGLLSVNGDGNTGFVVSTDAIELSEEKSVPNKVTIAKEKDAKYEAVSMFAEEDGKENRIDLSYKKVLQMNYEKEPVCELNGRVVAPTESKAKPSDINKVYANKDGFYNESYKAQKMLALTIEFQYDDFIPEQPYIKVENKKMMYDAGLYNEADVQVEKLNPEGEWEIIETQKMDLNGISSGELHISGTFLKGKSITISTSEKKLASGEKKKGSATLKIPSEEGMKFVSQFNAVTEDTGDVVRVKDETVLLMAESVSGENRESILKPAIEGGLTPQSIYKNNEEFRGDNNVLYAVTIRMY